MSHAIGRRRFLLGTGGAVMGLPLLEGLMPRTANAAAGPTFLFAFAQPYGVCQGLDGYPESFWPDVAPAAGSATSIDAAALSGALAAGRSTGELSSIANHVTFLRGIDNLVTTGDVNHHENGYCQTLTGSAFRRLDPNDHTSPRPLSEDIAQRAARELGGLAPLNIFSNGGPGNAAPWIARADNLARPFNDAHNEITYKPLEVYQRIFNLNVPGQLLDSRKSVNDLVKARLDALRSQSRLSKDDRVRLEAHLDAVRTIENRLQQQLACGSLAESNPLKQAVNRSSDTNVGFGEPSYFNRYQAPATSQENAETLIDLAVMGLACGSTRVVRFFSKSAIMGRNTDMFASGSPEFNNGMALEMHDYSHRLTGSGDSGTIWQDRLRRFDAWHMRRFVRIVNGLKEHGILDNGVAMFHSEQGNGYHSMTNIPFVLAGNCGGKLQTGKVIAANCKNNKLLATVGAALGLKDNDAAITQFGGLYEDGRTEPGGYVDALKGNSFA